MSSILDAYNAAMAERREKREWDKAAHREKRRRFMSESALLHNQLQDLSYTAQRRAGVANPKVKYIKRSETFDWY